jgi:hypothetical protein
MRNAQAGILASYWNTNNKHVQNGKSVKNIRKEFLIERADFLAQQLRTTDERALMAILQSEESRWIYKNIKEIMGKQRSVFTQVDVPSDTKNPSSQHTTLTSKLDIEEQILQRNRWHSLQSLSTPFLSNALLCSSINPHDNNSGLNDLLDGSFLSYKKESLQLSEDETKWIEELHRIVHEKIH